MFKYSIFGLASLLAIGSYDVVAANTPDGERTTAGSSSTFGESGNFNSTPGVDQDGYPGAPEGTFRYLFIAGSAFTPRTSAQTVTYPGAGCINSSDFVTTSLELPNGTELSGFRLYYFSNTVGANVTGIITEFDGSGGATGLANGSSSTSTGYGDVYVPVTTAPVIINATSRSYVLLADMAVGTRFCGMRVFYSN